MKASKILCLSLALTTGFFMPAQEAKAERALSISIYQNGLGFVSDNRAVPLEKGAQTLAVEDIPASMIIDSLMTRAEGFVISQRRFDFEQLNPQTLLEKSVGKMVSFRKTNPVNGKEEIIRAKLLAARGGVVIEREGRIETGQPGTLVLSEMPDDLHLSPSLSLKIASETQGTGKLGLAYLSDGLTWHASYSAELGPKGETIRLRPWANLGNTTGADFKAARLQLAAGRLYRRTAPPVRPAAMKAESRMMAMSADMGQADAVAPPEAIGAVQFFDIREPVDLNHNEMHQVGLFAPQTVAVKRTLVSRFPTQYGQMPPNQDTAQHPEVEIAFKNETDFSLPGGIVRLFGRSANGALRFIGEDNMTMKAKGEEVRLVTGQSFDVTLQRTQTEFELGSGKNQFEASYKVVIKNATRQPETVRFEETFPGEWELRASDVRPTEREGRRAVWEIALKAGEEKTVTYSIWVKTR